MITSQTLGTSLRPVAIGGPRVQLAVDLVRATAGEASAPDRDAVLVAALGTRPVLRRFVAGAPHAAT